MVSYHHEFQAWMNERLGLGLDLPPPVPAGAYRKWTAEELDRFIAASQAHQPADHARHQRSSLRPERARVVGRHPVEDLEGGGEGVVRALGLTESVRSFGLQEQRP